MPGTRSKHSANDPRDPFVRWPLDIHQALAKRGSAEDRVLRVIAEDFYAPWNLDEAKQPKKAVPLSYGDLRGRTGLGNSGVLRGIGRLEGQRIIRVLRHGSREALYAINPVEIWWVAQKQAPRGAWTQRRRQLRALQLHPGAGAV